MCGRQSPLGASPGQYCQQGSQLLLVGFHPFLCYVLVCNNLRLCFRLDMLSWPSPKFLWLRFVRNISFQDFYKSRRSPHFALVVCVFDPVSSCVQRIYTSEYSGKGLTPRRLAHWLVVLKTMVFLQSSWYSLTSVSLAAFHSLFPTQTDTDRGIFFLLCTSSSTYLLRFFPQTFRKQLEFTRTEDCGSATYFWDAYSLALGKGKAMQSLKIVWEAIWSLRQRRTCKHMHNRTCLDWACSHPSQNSCKGNCLCKAEVKLLVVEILWADNRYINTGSPWKLDTGSSSTSADKTETPPAASPEYKPEYIRTQCPPPKFNSHLV